MSEHVFPEGHDHCVHCGTWKGNPGRTICPHGAPAVSELRPEPTERQYAVYDQNTISARLVELRSEREAAWNTVKED